MPGWKSADARIHRACGFRAITTQQKVRYKRFIELPGNFRHSSQRRKCIAETDSPAGGRIIKRPCANKIPHTVERPLLRIVKRKRKITENALQASFAPHLPGPQQDFLVGSVVWHSLAVSGQLPDQLRPPIQSNIPKQPVVPEPNGLRRLLRESLLEIRKTRTHAPPRPDGFAGRTAHAQR